MDPAVLSAIGGLGAGALVGALATYFLGQHAQQKRDTKEKQGLLRLVLVEMTENTASIGMYRSDLSQVNVANEVWKASRSKIAQQLGGSKAFVHDFATLVRYYQVLDVFVQKLQKYNRLAEEAERVAKMEDAELGENEADDKSIITAAKEAASQKAAKEKDLVQRLNTAEGEELDSILDEMISQIAEEKEELSLVSAENNTHLDAAIRREAEREATRSIREEGLRGVEGIQRDVALRTALRWSDKLDDNYQQAVAVLRKHLHVS